MNSQALRLSALVAAAMSAGYLWRAALDGEAPQRVLAGVPSELRCRARTNAVQFPVTHSTGLGASCSACGRYHRCFLGDVLGSERGVRKARLVRASRHPAPPARTWLGEPLPEARQREGQGEEPTTEATAGAAGAEASAAAWASGEPATTTSLRLRPVQPPAPPAPPAPPPPPPFHKEIRPGKGKGDKNHVHTGSGWGHSEKHRERGGDRKGDEGRGQGGKKQEEQDTDAGQTRNQGDNQGNGGNQGNGHGGGNGNDHGNGGEHGHGH